MDKITDELKQAIRLDKQNGLSLRIIAARYGISKTTVSQYCRDLYYHPTRVYQTLEELTKHRSEMEKKYKCKVCGKSTKSQNHICAVCFQASRTLKVQDKTRVRRKFTCPECGLKAATNKGRICRACYIRLKTKRTTILENPTPVTIKPENKKPSIGKKNSKAKQLAYCPDSPTKAHHWILDALSMGKCKYCPAVKDFSDGKKPLTINPQVYFT